MRLFYLHMSRRDLLQQTCAASLGVSLILAGCGGPNTQHSSHPASTASPSKTQDPAQKGAWVTAAQKHNNSGINVRYLLGGKADVGKTIALQIEFSGVSSDDAVIQMQWDQALTVASNASAGLQKTAAGYQMALSKAQSSSQALNITALAPGMHYVQILLSQNGKQSMVAIAVPVGEGPFATPTLGEVQTTPSGEKIVVMPAK